MFMLSYFGDHPGVEIASTGGSIAVMSSLSLTRSGPNQSDILNRAMRFEYSIQPLEDPDTGRFFYASEPFLLDG